MLLYLLKKFPRLSETFVLNEILALEREGLDLRVLSRRPADPEPRHPQFASLRATVEELPGPRTLDPLGELFAADAREPGLLDAVRELVRDPALAAHPRLTELVGEALWLRRRARELGARHVHAHFATDSAVAAHLARRLGGPSYSITAHAKDIYRTTVNARLLELLIAESAFTVTVCDANVRHLARLIGERARARVRRLYNGVDLELFRPTGAGREPGHLLGVGRLVAKKGFDVLVEAVALLRARGVDCRATIAGDGEERARLEELVARRGLAREVTLVGAVDAGRVRDLVARASVLVLPCRESADGNKDALPTVLLEALAAGLPCVSTPVSGVPEILDHGRAGSIVPENDAQACAAAVELLLADRALAAELAGRGRAHAERHFDLRQSARTLAGWFAPQLAEPERGAAGSAGSGNAEATEGTKCASPA